IELKEKLDEGEWIAITADRTSVTRPDRVVQADFLGHPAFFPQSPFILASALKCPVFLMFALKEKLTTRIYIEPFEATLSPEMSRADALVAAAGRFAGRLEHYCLKAPLDWFNFYPFW